MAFKEKVERKNFIRNINLEVPYNENLYLIHSFTFSLQGSKMFLTSSRFG